ncbi:MAG: hypothetical protein RLY31_1006 [Bacteroidota bacterium]|jgi:UDP-N-acetylmuramate dehydrogenase
MNGDLTVAAHPPWSTVRQRTVSTSKITQSMQLEQHFSLKSMNTFQIDAIAPSFCRVRSVAHLREVLSTWRQPVRILGGGSNILPVHPIEGLVIRLEIPGVEILSEQGAEVLVGVGAGVEWHSLVRWCIDRGLGGLENLSLIPGSAGAAPIQNIGAYGVELKDVFHSLEAVDLRTLQSVEFGPKDCAFGYRDSVFKREAKGRYAITGIRLRLSREHRLQLSYGDIRATLARMGIERPTIRDVSDAVSAIRRSKLPDPARIGNAGSFFKNPVVSAEVLPPLKARYPELVSFPQSDGTYKLAAGWLVERAGWKGKSVGPAGCHERQALVLVNLGGATGEDILALSKLIRDDVRAMFGVELETEVNVW